MKLLNFTTGSKIGAGSKAPDDISKIIVNKYNFPEKNIIHNFKKNKIIKKIQMYISAIVRMYNAFIMSNSEYYILQTNYLHSPLFLPKIYMKIIKKKKIILYIHDINGLRYLNNKYLKKELKLFNSANYLIAHNYAMKKFLIENGIEESKIFELKCFDYLCNNKIEEKCIKHKNSKLVICYAGNLRKDKSTFLYQIESNKMNFKLNVYGNGLTYNINEKIIYKGCYNAEDVRNTLVGDIGLVWDGKLDESDENMDYKNYTKYNNPHKLSCYLAADLPVIVWRKSAIAEFVRKNNIGYLINNIYEINDIDFSNYSEKKANARKIGEKVRNGYYTINVLNEIINDIKQKEKRNEI